MDDDAALAAAFDDADEFEFPPDDEWDSFNLTDVSQGNAAIRLLRKMRENRRQVMAVADVDYKRIQRVYEEKRAEVDQFVADRLGRQDQAEPRLEQWLVGLAAREMDVRLAQDPKAPKTVHFVNARVASRAVGGQPEIVERDGWLPWAVDHDEVDEASPCPVEFSMLCQIDSLLSRLIIFAIDAAVRDGEGEDVSWLQMLRVEIDEAQEAIAVAQAKGARPVWRDWTSRYYWFSGQPPVVVPETGEVIEGGVPAAWYPKGDLQPYPVPGVGRREPGRSYDLQVDD